ncbi:VWA domain-containing protein [Lichenicola sp.]|uniref:VWA domain-containing protein n=1 Tax=Lichenicola sp. TaxID=2804529 RepID=UPI003B00AABB
MSDHLTRLTSVRFQPLLPPWLLYVLAGLCLVVTLLALWRRSGGAGWRGLCFALLLLWLAGPMLAHATWADLPETLLLVVDRSGSMAVGTRAAMARHAVAQVEAEAARMPGLAVRVVPVLSGTTTPAGGEQAGAGGTRLMGAIERAAADIPPGDGGSRIAGIIAVTDGQVHDVPALPAPGRKPVFPPGNPDVPLHVLITAAGEQTDRRLRVLQAPPFGIVGQNVTLRVEVEDLGPHPAGDTTATLTLKRDGDTPIQRDVPVGQPQDITVPVTRPGPMLLALQASTLPGEVSTLNNQAIVQINGVRDRLRVLLVSGAPNQGERVWRRLLKADPSVDLVHFTILRPPDKDDTTPLNELALIAFPVRELFQEKIGQFDLIILDGFENRGILPMSYLRNIADFVRAGGGLLLTAGPEFIGPGTLQDTPLGDILPARVPEEGGLVEQRYQPMPTALGSRHPVTEGLPQTPPPAGTAAGNAGWGPWYRALVADPSQLSAGAQVLMTGPQQSPLLVLNRVDQGRVALLLSDQIWLWSRGEGGGGPQAELLRRLAHWLMKEPELEEEQLTAGISDGRLTATRRSVSAAAAMQVTVIAPDGSRHPLDLAAARPGPGEPVAAGVASAGIDATAPGIWEVTDGHNRAFAAARPADPLEIADLRATATALGPFAAATGGSTHWLGGDPGRPDVPELQLVGPHQRAYGAGLQAVGGRDWIGLRQHGAHVVTGEQADRLLAGWAVLPLALLLLLLAWRREGRG